MTAGASPNADSPDPDAVLAAMADATRRQLLTALAARGPATATSLADGLPISRQAVAKHLAVLAHAGLVTSSRHGRDVRFDIRTTVLTQTAAWLTTLAAEWDERLDLIKQIAESGDEAHCPPPRSGVPGGA